MREEQSWESILENKLKRLSTSDLEKIISKAISQAVGEDYEASVLDIDYDPDRRAGRKAAKVTLTLSDLNRETKF